MGFLTGRWENIPPRMNYPAESSGPKVRKHRDLRRLKPSISSKYNCLVPRSGMAGLTAFGPSELSEARGR
jgi:hypothetical protein